MGKILRISLKLNFTPNTLGCYGSSSHNGITSCLGGCRGHLFFRGSNVACSYDDAYVIIQWAAVSTTLSLTMAPPQKKSFSNKMATCHGNSAGRASSPPIMRSSATDFPDKEKRVTRFADVTFTRRFSFAHLLIWEGEPNIRFAAFSSGGCANDFGPRRGVVSARWYLQRTRRYLTMGANLVRNPLALQKGKCGRGQACCVLFFQLFLFVISFTYLRIEARNCRKAALVAVATESGRDPERGLPTSKDASGWAELPRTLQKTKRHATINQHFNLVYTSFYHLLLHLSGCEYIRLWRRET